MYTIRVFQTEIEDEMSPHVDKVQVFIHLHNVIAITVNVFQSLRQVTSIAQREIPFKRFIS